MWPGTIYIKKPLWNSVLDTVSNSYHLREEYRNNILPKIIESRKEDSLTNRKLKAKIKRIQRQLSDVDSAISKFETDVILKRHSGNPKQIRKNLEQERSKIEHNLGSAHEEYRLLQLENSWVDWLALFKKEVQDKSNLTEEQKRDYLQRVVDRIEVRFDQEENRHELQITFRVPIVEDQIVYNNPDRRTEGWVIEDGVHTQSVVGILNGGPGRPRKKKH